MQGLRILSLIRFRIAYPCETWVTNSWNLTTWLPRPVGQRNWKQNYVVVSQVWIRLAWKKWTATRAPEMAVVSASQQSWNTGSVNAAMEHVTRCGRCRYGSKSFTPKFWMILNKIGAKSVNKFWPIRMLRVFLIKNAGDYRRLPPIEGVQHPLSKLPVLHCRTWRSWICMKLKLYLSWGTWVFRQFYLIHLLNLQWCKYVHVCVYAYACMCMYVYIYMYMICGTHPQCYHS